MVRRGERTVYFTCRPTCAPVADLSTRPTRRKAKGRGRAEKRATIMMAMGVGVGVHESGNVLKRSCGSVPPSHSPPTPLRPAPWENVPVSDALGYSTLVRPAKPCGRRVRTAWRPCLVERNYNLRDHYSLALQLLVRRPAFPTLSVTFSRNRIRRTLAPPVAPAHRPPALHARTSPARTAGEGAGGVMASYRLYS
ncbi:hypothetical protein ANO11243_058020 [Dothideomycetidae sp. 11243]|nr:hypothetical protein ANO11243_058020 [fungal sp. No.11243]